MKNIEKELLGFTVPVTGVCETIAELVTAAGSEEVVVNDNNNQVLAHSHFSVLRNVIVAKLEEATGVKRKTVKNKLVEKDGDEETHGKYRARLDEELGEEVVNSYAVAIASACGAVAVDYKPGARGSGESAKPAAKWLAYWDEAVKQGKLDAYLAKFGIDTTKTEDEQKVDFANAVKKKVTAAMQAAAQTALA